MSLSLINVTSVFPNWRVRRSSSARMRSARKGSRLPPLALLLLLASRHARRELGQVVVGSVASSRSRRHQQHDNRHRTDTVALYSREGKSWVQLS